MKNGLFTINLADLGKGVIMAILTALSASLLVILSGDPSDPTMHGHLPSLLELKNIGLGALSVGIIYLLKNFLSNSQGQFLKK